MPGSWRTDRRRTGIGLVLGFALWVAAIAMVYALMAGQARSSVVGDVSRLAARRLALVAAGSALDEASWVLRHPADPEAQLLATVQASASGTVHDPAATREAYDRLYPGAVTLAPVQFEVKQKGRANSRELWLVDLTVRVRASSAGATAALQLRRRHAGSLVQITGELGPHQGETLFERLVMLRDPVALMVEP